MEYIRKYLLKKKKIMLQILKKGDPNEKRTKSKKKIKEFKKLSKTFFEFFSF